MKQTELTLPGSRDKPRRVLTTYWDGGGNVPPQRALARELIRRGHDVHVLTHNSLAGAVASDGATFHALKTAPQWDGSQPHAPGAESEYIVDGIAGSATFTADFLALHDALRPDMSVIDVMLVKTIGSVSQRGLPYITLNHLAWNLEGAATKLLGDLAKVHTGLGFFELLGRAPAVLATTYPEFGTAEHVASNVHFVGPIREPVTASPWPRRFPDRPFVLVSLSSVFQEQQGTLQKVCEALSPLPLEVLVTTGRGISPDSLPIAGGLEARQFIPHDAVLPYVDLVIGHGGLGTAMFSAAAGVPILVLPNGRDQNDNAKRLEALGIGRELSCDCPAQLIVGAVAEMLADQALRHRCGSFANKVHRFGELGRAADLVVGYPEVARTA